MFIKYFENGYMPVRVNKNSKVPVETNWQRVCEERPSVAQVEAWQRLYDSYPFNIGIACGSSSNILVLDIDTDDKYILDACPVSPVRRRGQKGDARFFKYNPNIKAEKFKSVHIEALGTGNQIVVPPSIHPETGRPYEWLGIDTIETICANDLPELDLSFLPGLLKKYPDTNASVVSSGGRNDTLKRILSAMKNRGVSDQEIMIELYNYDLNKHEPRLFTDPTSRFTAKNEDDVMKNVAKFYYSIVSSMAKKGLVSFSDSAELVIDLSSDDIESRKHAKFKPKPYPRVRGIMGKFVDYCELVSSGNQDALGIGGAISLMSVLCANRFSTEVRGLTTTPNIYVINLAHSSFGKETAQKVIHELLHETQLLGGASYRSGSSIVQNLPTQQERLDLIDECSSIIRAMTAKEDYKAEIVEVLSSLYSKANGKFLGFTSVTHGEKFGACWTPCISILGSTTPAGFRGSVNRDMAAKGLLPRFFLFNQHELGAYKGRQPRVKAEKLREELEAFIFSMMLEPKPEYPGYPIKNILAKVKRGDDEDVTEGIRYQPTVIPFSHEAHEYWLEFDEECHYKKAKDPEGFESAFIGRFAEKTAKLALLDAISLGQREVDLDNVKWARELVEADWHNSAPLYELASAENQTESYQMRVQALIESKGSITRTELYTKTKWCTAKQREDILVSLIDQGSIEKAITRAHGAKKDTTMYLATKKH